MNKTFIHPSAVLDTPCSIGEGSKIWHFCHLMPDVRIGQDCVLGHSVFLGKGVRLGDACHIQNHVSIFTGVTLEDGVFVGPGAMFTNVLTPRAGVVRNNPEDRLPTVVRRGASIGANATVVCGVELGSYSLVAAGAVVTQDVPAHALVSGVPARQTGWVCWCGAILNEKDGVFVCHECARRYSLKEGILTQVP